MRRIRVEGVIEIGAADREIVGGGCEAAHGISAGVHVALLPKVGGGRATGCAGVARGDDHRHALAGGLLEHRIDRGVIRAQIRLAITERQVQHRGEVLIDHVLRGHRGILVPHQEEVSARREAPHDLGVEKRFVLIAVVGLTRIRAAVRRGDRYRLNLLRR